MHIYITYIFLKDDENFDVEEEDVRRIVRKSLEPEHNETNLLDNESNETDVPESFDKSMNDEKLQDNDDAFNEMIEDALNEIRNFVPKRKRQEKPMFVDLSVEGEKRLRSKNGGAPYYWHMPFRHSLFLKDDAKYNSSSDDSSTS